MTPPGYEAFFGLVERPFSLTPDQRYFFKNSSHGRILETLIFGLRRREPFLLVAGDLGVGKTVLGRVLADQLKRKGPVSFVSNPLVTATDLLRLLLEDFRSPGADPRPVPGTVTAFDQMGVLAQVLADAQKTRSNAVVIIDDAHRLPAALLAPLATLAAPEPGSDPALQVVLLGQAPPHQPFTLGSLVEDRISTTTRLATLNREECADYVRHRLRVAGGGARAIFSTRAIDMLFGLSNGLPRLVNLLCERALQDAAMQHTQTIEPGMVAGAASALELTFARPRRFRWFSKRVS